jgi:hypothetical protein
MSVDLPLSSTPRLASTVIGVLLVLLVFKAKLLDQLLSIFGLTNEDVILHLFNLKSQEKYKLSHH